MREPGGEVGFEGELVEVAGSDVFAGLLKEDVVGVEEDAGGVEEAVGALFPDRIALCLCLGVSGGLKGRGKGGGTKLWRFAAPWRKMPAL